MMQKIYSISSVRNEADVIESFVRHSLTIVDGMVINENCSSDNTLEILNELKKEGLNIDIRIDNKSNFSQSSTITELTEYVIEKHHPDYILALDADEFLFSEALTSPRELILSLDPMKVNKLKWVTFVYKRENNNSLFTPRKFEQRRIFNEEYCKSVLSKELFKIGGRFSIGAHEIMFSDEKRISNFTSNDLYIAHYPVRSPEQLICKVAVGVLNKLSIYSYDSGIGYHQLRIFDKLLELGEVSEKECENYSLYYAIKETSGRLRTSQKPLKLNYEPDPKIKNKIKSVQILSLVLETSSAIIEELRENKNKLELQIDKSSSLIRKNEELEATLNQIVSSRGWRTLESIRKILIKFK